MAKQTPSRKSIPTLTLTVGSTPTTTEQALSTLVNDVRLQSSLQDPKRLANVAVAVTLALEANRTEHRAEGRKQATVLSLAMALCSGDATLAGSMQRRWADAVKWAADPGVKQALTALEQDPAVVVPSLRSVVKPAAKPAKPAGAASETEGSDTPRSSDLGPSLPSPQAVSGATAEEQATALLLAMCRFDGSGVSPTTLGQVRKAALRLVALTAPKAAKPATKTAVETVGAGAAILAGLV